MSLDLLDIEPDPVTSETALGIEPDPVPTPATIAPVALVELLGPDVALPTLIKWVPDPRLKTQADGAAAFALAMSVAGAKGLEAADVALTALRGSLNAISAHFEEPTQIAHGLHKRLTGLRGEWRRDAEAALKTVSDRVALEDRRLKAEAETERRKQQDAADKIERERLAADAKRAEQQKAPAPVVEEMKRRAETATAAPVPVSTPAPVMKGTTTTSTWKTRTDHTSAEAEDTQPDVEKMLPAQLADVLVLLRNILDGKAPVAAIAVNWSYLDKRAVADKSTFNVPGIHAYEKFGTRAKSTR